MCVFYKYWKRLFVKRLLVKKTFQFCIDYESHKYMLRILFYKKIRRAYHQLQLEACYILLHPKLKIKFCTRWNPNWLENYMPNYLCYLTVNLIFLLCSIMITQLLSTCLKGELQFLSVSEIGKFHSYSTLALNLTTDLLALLLHGTSGQNQVI